MRKTLHVELVFPADVSPNSLIKLLEPAVSDFKLTDEKEAMWSDNYLNIGLVIRDWENNNV